MKLKEYQEKRNSCKYCVSSKNGLWCNDRNIKCSLQNCLDTPSFPMELSKEKHGYHKSLLNDLGGLSKLHANAYYWYLKGESFKWIGKRIKRSKSRAYQLVNETKGYLNKLGLNDKGIPCTVSKSRVKNRLGKKVLSSVRLHNDYVKFSIEPCSFLLEKVVKLKYTEYLPVKDDFKYVQIFTNGTLTVRFRKDVVGCSVDDVTKRGNRRIYDFINNFNVSGVNFVDGGKGYVQKSREYAFLETGMAAKYIKEGRKFFRFDKVDGKCRIEIDFSKSEPEFENPHPVHGFTDAKKSEKVFGDLKGDKVYWDDIIENDIDDFDKPTVTKKKIDTLMSNYVQTVREASKMNVWMAENFKSHQRILEKLERAVDKSNKKK